MMCNVKRSGISAKTKSVDIGSGVSGWIHARIAGVREIVARHQPSQDTITVIGMVVPIRDTDSMVEVP